MKTSTLFRTPTEDDISEAERLRNKAKSSLRTSSLFSLQGKIFMQIDACFAFAKAFELEHKQEDLFAAQETLYEIVCEPTPVWLEKTVERLVLRVRSLEAR
jgi:hypothetical protein